jgi:2-oxoglutarate dehydrogenase complex dehydrogenase (E1) component-like enzyme
MHVIRDSYSPDSEIGLRGKAAESRKVAEADDNNWLGVNNVPHPNVHVRLSGQDVIRGTFNQRHASIYCQATERAYVQLNSLENSLSTGKTERAMLSACNSSLSEAAVLGFEYGAEL